MAEYVNREMFLSSMGLVGDETKYGNRDSEHQGRSYGTWMGYEIMDSIDNCVEEDVVKVVRCKDCSKRYNPNECPMCHLVLGKRYESTTDDGYCYRGERRTEL